MNVIHKNVLVEIPEVITKKGGVFLPESDIVSERQGKVIRIGDSVPKEVQEQLRSNPNIEYREFYTGGKVTVEGKEYLVINYEDILIIK